MKGFNLIRCFANNNKKEFLHQRSNGGLIGWDKRDRWNR